MDPVWRSAKEPFTFMFKYLPDGRVRCGDAKKMSGLKTKFILNTHKHDAFSIWNSISL